MAYDWQYNLGNELDPIDSNSSHTLKYPFVLIDQFMVQSHVQFNLKAQIYLCPMSDSKSR